VAVATTVIDQDQVEVWISADYLTRTEITSIVPEPQEEIVADDRVIYRFTIDNQGERPTIHFALEHDDPGATTGRIGVIDGPDLTFWQFVYP
jgi:hypothetical protein